MNRTDEFPASRLDNKVMRGRNGRLFLDNDTNLVIAQHRGQLRFSDAQLRQWRFVLETRVAWLKNRGADHYFLVAPNAHSVYPEDLPPEHEMSEDRPIIQLMEYLEARKSYATLTYPLDELVAERQQCMFGKTETHWSEFGAFVAYERLAKEIAERHAIHLVTREDLRVIEKDFVGDLGIKVEPAQSAPLVFVDVQPSQAELVADNRVMNQGRRIEYRSTAAPECRCLVYGDSFAHRIVPFIAESFSHTVSAHISTLDYELVERERPDLVIGVMNERFLISVPDDLTAQSLDDLAAEKQAAGQVYSPREWTGTTRVDSPTVGIGTIPDLTGDPREQPLTGRRKGESVECIDRTDGTVPQYGAETLLEMRLQRRERVLDVDQVLLRDDEEAEAFGAKVFERLDEARAVLRRPRSCHRRPAGSARAFALPPSAARSQPRRTGCVEPCRSVRGDCLGKHLRGIDGHRVADPLGVVPVVVPMLGVKRRIDAATLEEVVGNLAVAGA